MYYADMQFWVSSFTLSDDNVLVSLYIGKEINSFKLRLSISLVELTLNVSISKATQKTRVFLQSQIISMDSLSVINVANSRVQLEDIWKSNRRLCYGSTMGQFHTELVEDCRCDRCLLLGYDIVISVGGRRRLLLAS